VTELRSGSTGSNLAGYTNFVFSVRFFFWGGGARGSVVVKALSYKLEGRVFDNLRDDFLNLPNLSGR
jgi:hypothetical protein